MNPLNMSVEEISSLLKNYIDGALWNGCTKQRDALCRLLAKRLLAREKTPLVSLADLKEDTAYLVLHAGMKYGVDIRIQAAMVRGLQSVQQHILHIARTIPLPTSSVYELFDRWCGAVDEVAREFEIPRTEAVRLQFTNDEVIRKTLSEEGARALLSDLFDAGVALTDNNLFVEKIMAPFSSLRGHEVYEKIRAITTHLVSLGTISLACQLACLAQTVESALHRIYG